MRTLTASLVAIVVALVVTSSQAQDATPARRTQNVLLVTLDGVRWQEVFRGAEERLISKAEGNVADVEGTRAKYWRPDAQQRRSVLMPFVWSVVAREGQLFGDRDRHSDAKVLNREHFSYPGYQEILCGYPDERIQSNDKVPNVNITVLEWLARRPSIGRRVAAFTSWDAFPAIINDQRAGFPINAGWVPLEVAETERELEVVNRLIKDIPLTWRGSRYDGITAYGAREYVKQKKPRVLFLSLGETDERSHEGRYDLYLDAVHQGDALVRELWELMQSMPEYAGTTSLVLVVDHGRGREGDGWKNHSKTIPGSDEIWIAVMGPDTPALGLRENVEVTQGQVAATVAGLLGEDYQAAVPQAGPVLPGVIGAR